MRPRHCARIRAARAHRTRNLLMLAVWRKKPTHIKKTRTDREHEYVSKQQACSHLMSSAVCSVLVTAPNAPSLPVAAKASWIWRDWLSASALFVNHVKSCTCGSCVLAIGGKNKKNNNIELLGAARPARRFTDCMYVQAGHRTLSRVAHFDGDWSAVYSGLGLT